MSRARTWLIIPDLHYPYHDQKFINITTKLLKELRPDGGLVQLGDALDFYQISAYDKDPARNSTITDDLLMYKIQLHEWADYMRPGAQVRQLEGNHCDRLRRYIWRNAPALHKAIKSVPETLGFRDGEKINGIIFKWYPLSDWRACQIGNVILHHGHFFNKHTAVTLLERYPKSIITGHTHRLQYVTNGERFACTLGHGALAEDISHTPTPHGWQQALGILTELGPNTYLEIVTIHDGEAYVRGKRIFS